MKRQGKETRASSKQKQVDERLDTMKKATQSQNQREKTVVGNRSVSINTNSETGGVENEEVSLKGGASTLEDTIKAVLEKYMRPPSLCLVQVSSASELTASTVAMVKSEITKTKDKNEHQPRNKKSHKR